MALSAGTRLGAYEVISLLGAGGMGEVYRGMDTNLGRRVAIKVLPETFALDAERLARFEREAKTLASLNHPNIAQIYGFEKSSDVHALVMELVEGVTLADRIAQGAIPLDDALPIAKQIAEALEAAHEVGIIHRDLKPANIKVRHDGMVKVLDFGLAKVTEPARSMSSGLSYSPTITTPAMTQAGMILGTAAYMSPEQVKGRAADKRSDMWAFGCVLYEMLTGTRAFEGDDVGEVLASVIKSEVDWGRLGADVPPRIRMLLRRCLRKEHRQRLGDAGAARLEIEEAATAPQEGARSSRRQQVVPLSLALLVGLGCVASSAAITAWLFRTTSPSSTQGVTRMEIALPPGVELPDGPSAVISPDGTRVAYVGSRGGIPQLYVRSMNEVDARPLANTQRAAGPFFSPDSTWLGFFADGRLKKISISSGVVVDLAEAPGPRGLAGAWGPTDTIVYPGLDGLAAIAASGGATRSLMTPEQRAAGGNALFPEFLPDGDMLLVSSTSGDANEDRSIDLLRLSTGERRVLVQRGLVPRYLPTGHLVFLREGAVMAMPFDAEKMEPSGAPIEVLRGVRQSGFFGAFSCSHAGSCVYVAGGTGTERRVALVDRTGNSRQLSLAPSTYQQPRFSPSGDKLSLWIGRSRCDIEVYDLTRGTTTRLTSEGDNHVPVWAPDGKRITYISRKTGATGYELFSRPADGGGSEDRLTSTDRNLGPIAPLTWSPDGTLVFANRGDLWSMSLSSNSEPRPFAPSRFTETSPAFSPDGRWLAYVSDESGRFEVYVRPFPGPGEKYPISVNGGLEPVWDRQGKELFFRNANQLLAVEVRTQTSFSTSRPRLLFTGPFSRSSDFIDYDISPDGESFVMVNAGEEDRPATQVNVVFNWFDELKARVPAN